MTTRIVDAINTKQQMMGILDGMTDAVALIDLRSSTDMVETLRAVTADCQELLNLVHNLQAWAERTDDLNNYLDSRSEGRGYGWTPQEEDTTKGEVIQGDLPIPDEYDSACSNVPF